MNNKSTPIIIILVLLVVAGAIYFFNKEATQPDGSDQPAMVSDDAMENSEMQSSLLGESVEYMPGVTGYLSTPEGNGPFPGVILIHEWWGLNDDIKSIADRFAQEGYAALAVDLYDGESTTERERAGELAGAVRGDVDGAFVNLESALAYLKDQPGVDTSRLASVGWCFGGGWAYQMARNGLDIGASVMYYGQFDPEDDFAMMKADILGHFGEEDAAIAVDSVREFQAALETTNGMHEVYIYPNVGHGFANQRGGDNLAYSEEAAETAWQRTMEFLTNRFNENAMMESGDAMEETSNVKEFTLTGKNFEFSMDEIRVNKGDTVRINFTSESGFHDWVVDEFDAATAQLRDGESDSIEFVANEAGEFEYYCSVGRHRENGMVGKLIVE